MGRPNLAAHVKNAIRSIDQFANECIEQTTGSIGCKAEDLESREAGESLFPLCTPAPVLPCSPIVNFALHGIEVWSKRLTTALRAAPVWAWLF